MRDELGDRMKSQYEDRTRALLPRRTYTILRLDGKAFHTYTRGLNKPFDLQFNQDIDSAVCEILPEMHGARLAYVQSDEISILLTDFTTPTTCAWFDGNIQKMVSVAASLMTARFNLLRLNHMQYKDTSIFDDLLTFKLAAFDARAFTIPDPVEVYNYFVWRNQDAARNSLSVLAQSVIPHKQLQGVNGKEQQELLKQYGIDYNAGPNEQKYGRVIIKSESIPPTPITNMLLHKPWTTVPAWKFSESPQWLQKQIPGFLLPTVPPLPPVELTLGSTLGGI